MRQAVGERRTVVEDVLVGVGASPDRLLERVALRPRGQDIGLDAAERKVAGRLRGTSAGSCEFMLHRDEL